MHPKTLVALHHQLYQVHCSISQRVYWFELLLLDPDNRLVVCVVHHLAHLQTEYYQHFHWLKIVTGLTDSLTPTLAHFKDLVEYVLLRLNHEGKISVERSRFIDVQDRVLSSNAGRCEFRIISIHIMCCTEIVLQIPNLESFYRCN